MAGELTFEQIANLGKEAVAEKFLFIGENKTPLLDWLFGKKKRPLDEQGYRMPIITQRPGGHNAYAQSSSEFRVPIPMDSDSMRVYPTWYQIGQKFNGSVLRALRSGNQTQLLSYRSNMRILTDAAKKRLNQTFHEGGTGALAVCGSIVTAANASATMTMLTLASSATGAAETKGGTRLERNHTYAVVNPADGVVRHFITILTPSKTAPTVSTGAGTSSASGDVICDLGVSNTVSTFNKWSQGLRSLAAAAGLLQGVNRTDFNEYKTPRVNGNDLPVTPYVMATAKAYVNIAANDMSEATGRFIVETPGQDMMFRIQQFGYRRYEGNETVKGVASKYVDADGDTVLFDADGAEDRIYILDGNSFYLGEEKPFGLYDEDGNELRMIAGTNGVGSDGFYLAIGWGGNMIKDVSESRIQCDAYIDRLSQTDVPQQTSF